MKTFDHSGKTQPFEMQGLQRALEESESRHSAFMASTLDCIICADHQARITDFNIAAEKTFRMSRQSVLGQDLCDAILPVALRKSHRRELFSNAISPAVEVIGNRMETRAMRADGSEFYAELSVSRVAIRNKLNFIVHVRDISARKRAEEANVWLAAIVENSKDAIYGEDLQGRITSWNNSAEALYGFRAEEVLGNPSSVLIPPGYADDIQEMNKNAERRNIVRDFESVRRAKDGRLIDVSLSISPVLQSGSQIGLSVIARDVTARKATEEALRKATETSVYASPIAIIALDLLGCVTLWNSAAERVFGWAEEEILGKPNPIVLGGVNDDAEIIHEQLLSGKTLTGIEVRRRRKDGSAVTISLSGTPIWDENHQVKGIIKFLTDITVQKQTEEMLRITEEKYRSMFENSLEGIYQIGPDGTYISANPALADMLGCDSPFVLTSGRSVVRKQDHMSPDRYTDYLRLLGQNGRVENFEYEIKGRNGKSVWLSENARVVTSYLGSVRYFEGSVQDITQRRELETQLRQMQKIEAVGRLAGGVAHDFNNILMAISSFGELLARKLPEGDTGRSYLEEIVKATERGSSLTQSLLAFSRKQVLSLRMVDLNTLIAGQIDMLKRLIPENIDLKFVPCENLGTIKVDPSQIEQVVLNLVINARDAMIDSGEILIETENVKLGKADHASQGPLEAGNYVVLAVSDNGCGMDAETKSQIFEPFFTTKQPGKGTGLGLATVFGIVKQSSGYIFVHSKPGHGTTFKVYIPEVAATAELIRKEIHEDCVTGNETILLVEDEEAVRCSTAEYLKENGYTVLVAGRGSEALKIAEAYHSPIHLLLSDLVMPKMSGRDLAEKVKVIHPETTVVFMSGYSNNLLSSQQMSDPRHVLLQKPFRLGSLGTCIRQALDKRSSAAAGR